MLLIEPSSEIAHLLDALTETHLNLKQIAAAAAAAVVETCCGLRYPGLGNVMRVL